MHVMAVKNSGARAGFLIYSYFKDSVFTAVIFSLFSVIFVLFKGIICYVIPYSIIHCLKSWWRL